MLRLGTLELRVPAVMGILNITPDSFSDGGRFATAAAALRQAELLAEAGAAIIDVGGESTRPGAAAVSEQEELERVIPVIERIREQIELPVSIDTSKPGVMRAAAEAGAVLINDVFALRLEGAVETAADLGLPVCLMHMQGEPRTMQQEPRYEDVVAEVSEFLAERARVCIAAGIPADRLILDPGFGFGKSPVHNMQLLGNLRRLGGLGYALLVGLSRKATLGAITGRDVHARLPASLAAAVLAAVQGAHIIRVHDVAETVDALKVTQAAMEAGKGHD